MFCSQFLPGFDNKIYQFHRTILGSLSPFVTSGKICVRNYLFLKNLAKCAEIVVCVVLFCVRDSGGIMDCPVKLI